ncbi:hypothetical protein LSAT2_006860 [Lamellibrachia satsuma]|nr:hypothetical protein LSAT2_006860 [Lamellibrachia satsuma]
MEIYYQPRWALFVEQLVWSIIYKAPFDEGQFNKDLFNKVEQPFTFDRTLWPTEQTGDTAHPQNLSPSNCGELKILRTS